MCNFKIFLECTFILFFTLFIKNGYLSQNCFYPQHKSNVPGMALISNMSGEIFEAKDKEANFLYKIGICVSPTSDDKLDPSKTGAVIQISIKTQKSYVIGRYNDTDIKTGKNWAFLEYGSGDKYVSHCSSSPRKALIMITCNPSLRKGVLKVLEENNDRDSNCYYLFELESPKLCSAAPTPKDGLSGWAIFFIIVLVLVTLYLSVGLAAKKLFYGASGIEAVPNIDFWRAVGSRIADCTECVCRPNSDPRNRREYRPADRNLEGGSLTINDLDPDDDADEDLVLP